MRELPDERIAVCRPAVDSVAAGFDIDQRAGQHEPSFARRRPENCQRAAGGKKLRYVGRAWPAGVARLLPRSTNWPTMNLPLYSPTAPASGRKPGYGSYDERVHCQTWPVICVMPGAP